MRTCFVYKICVHNFSRSKIVALRLRSDGHRIPVDECKHKHRGLALLALQFHLIEFTQMRRQKYLRKREKQISIFRFANGEEGGERETTASCTNY